MKNATPPRLDSASVKKLNCAVKRLEKAKLAHDLALIHLRFEAMSKAFGKKMLVINGVTAVRNENGKIEGFLAAARNENGKIEGFLGHDGKGDLERDFAAVFGFKL